MFSTRENCQQKLMSLPSLTLMLLSIEYVTMYISYHTYPKVSGSSMPVIYYQLLNIYWALICVTRNLEFIDLCLNPFCSIMGQTGVCFIF